MLILGSQRRGWVSTYTPHRPDGIVRDLLLVQLHTNRVYAASRPILLGIAIDDRPLTVGVTKEIALGVRVRSQINGVRPELKPVHRVVAGRVVERRTSVALLALDVAVNPVGDLQADIPAFLVVLVAIELFHK